MIAPSMEYVVRGIKITSQTVGILSVTIYILGFGLGPLVISSASKMHGRLTVYHVCNVLFIAFIVGTASSQTVPQLLVFRVLSYRGLCSHDHRRRHHRRCDPRGAPRSCRGAVCPWTTNGTGTLEFARFSSLSF